MDDPKNQEETTPPQTAPVTAKPAIRTMKSDIDELFKSTKPSLIQMMGKEMVSSPSRRIVSGSRNRSGVFFAVTGAALVLVLASTALFFVWQDTRKHAQIPPAPTPPSLPSPLFSTEETRSVTGTFVSRMLLAQQIENAVREGGREGTFTYLPIKIIENDQERFADSSDILTKLYRMSPPTELLSTLEGPATVFVYYTREGPRFGVSSRTRDLTRALHAMLTWESSLLGDALPIFFGENYESVVAPFEDRTYRNIDWRFLNLSSTEDFGIAYFFFPAKQIMVLATSQEAVEIIINRLYAE